ncbi:fibronectin type 3 and ankyrin repeat domains 1 protein [Diorhabda sublineata]|uniref:fibronectin type 3 and ankyrin repeat domains 1 protein n=1 Tax=Diorhabda sublineata TaxID=1163346 RepID=UPI0024E18850|nr:fibronectin type 3 and ankyrin repeat domains 1 protein [Diorhabda sublineata]
MDDENWIYFKGATDEGPFYTTMHMTRYVKLGKSSVVRKIANIRPYLLDTENRENKTPLIQSIEFNDIQMINLLISLGANVNKSVIYNKRSPLMIAIEKGRLQIARFLIDKGADVFARDINDLNLLHVAVDTNNLENVKFCFELIRNANFKDNKGWTPLLRAAIMEVSKDIIDFLIENGADTSVRDNNGIDFETHCLLTGAVFMH